MEKYVVISDLAGMRLDRYLKSKIPGLPQSMIQKWVRKGLIKVNSKRCKADVRVIENDTVTCPTFVPENWPVTKKVLELPAYVLKDFKAWIVHEDDDMLVINKPAGLAVQGGTGLKLHLDMILDALEAQEGYKMRLVHRLDKETSGLLILAKNRTAAERLTQQFKDREISKFYVALVVGRPEFPSGEIDLPLSKGMTASGERVITDTEDAREAITLYRVLQTLEDLSLILLEPKTGRTHQLRAHCQYGLGTPILGDGKYGGKGAQPFGREEHIFLHSCKLVIPTPDGKNLEITTKLPLHFFRYVKDLAIHI